MKIEDMESGMRVVIADDISTTHKRHSSCGEMLSMRGKTFLIEYVEDDYVAIGGFTWAPEDIRPFEVPDPDPIVFHFDEKHL